MSVEGTSRPLIGRVLHETYRITRLIGEGGMGAVYEASHLRLAKKRFAVKMLLPSVMEIPDVFTRFRREAEIATELGHPHIVDVLDFNQTDDGQPYMVMEFLDGEDLGRRLVRRVRLPAAEVTQIAMQVGSALQAAHDHEIVHRDMKPDNIFLVGAQDGPIRAKVLDFGISKIRHSSKSMATRDHSVLGTPSFMSPEQAEGSVRDIDQTTDIFALGSICYFALSGELPFAAPTIPGVLYKVCHMEPAPISTLVQGLPPAVDEVLGRAMAKRKPARYQRVEELARDLAVALAAMAQVEDFARRPTSVPVSGSVALSPSAAAAPAAQTPAAQTPAAQTPASVAASDSSSGASGGPSQIAPAQTVLGFPVVERTGPQLPTVPGPTGPQLPAAPEPTGPQRSPAPEPTGPRAAPRVSPGPLADVPTVAEPTGPQPATMRAFRPPSPLDAIETVADLNLSTLKDVKPGELLIAPPPSTRPVAPPASALDAAPTTAVAPESIGTFVAPRPAQAVVEPAAPLEHPTPAPAPRAAPAARPAAPLDERPTAAYTAPSKTTLSAAAGEAIDATAHLAPPSRRWKILVGAGCAAAALAVVVVLLVRRGGQDAPVVDAGVSGARPPAVTPVASPLAPDAPARPTVDAAAARPAPVDAAPAVAARRPSRPAEKRPPAAKAPVAKAPVAKTPAKAPAAKAPAAKAPAAKAPAAKAAKRRGPIFDDLDDAPKPARKQKPIFNDL